MSKLAVNNPWKFSLATPKQIDSAVHRLLNPQFQGEEGCPTAARVQGGIWKVLKSHKQVVKAHGALVKGSGDCSRKRANKVPDWHKQQGGSRKHNTKAAKAKFLLLHPDAQSALEETVVGYIDVFYEHETIEIVDGDDKKSSNSISEKLLTQTSSGPSSLTGPNAS